MKTVAIFVCCVFFVSYAVVRADDDAIPPSCLEKLGIRLIDLPSLLADKSDEGQKKYACLKACYMQNMGWMTGNTINVDTLKAEVDQVLGADERKEQVLESLYTCEAEAKAAGEDECDVAQEFSKCGFKQIRMGFHKMFHDMKHQDE